MTSESALPLPCGPADDGSDAPFWQGLREGRLVLPQCALCQEWREPGRLLCAGCWSFETQWSQVRPMGHVFTWIRSRRDFMDDLDVVAPYDTALVQLADVPVRLLGLVVDDVTTDIAIGQKLRGRVENPPNAEWPVLRWARDEAR